MARTGTLMPWSQPCCDALCDLTLRFIPFIMESQTQREHCSPRREGHQHPVSDCGIWISWENSAFHQEAGVAFSPAKRKHMVQVKN